MRHELNRLHQQETYEKILNSTAKYVIVEAAVGSGKSAYAAACGEFASLRTMVLTKTKSLQDQYGGSYDFKVVKGKGAYPCLHNFSPGADMCKIDSKEEKDLKRRCDEECPYPLACQEMLSSNLASLNYSKFFTELRQGGLVPKYGADVLFLDEAHQLSDITIEWSGCTLPYNDYLKQYTDFLEINKNLPQLVAINQAIDWLANLLDSLKDNEPYRPKRYEKKAVEAWRKWDSLKRKVENTLGLVEQGKEYWYIQADFQEGFYLKPLTARFHFPRLFNQARKIVLMSATIGEHRTFMSELGIYENYESIIVPNVWPAESRPVYDISEIAVTAKSTEEERKQHARDIAKAINACPGSWNGLVHVPSKRMAYELSQELKRLTGRRMWTTQDGMGTEEALQDWLLFESRNRGAIAVTHCFFEGVDLPNLNINITARCLTPDMNILSPTGYISIDNAQIGNKVFSITESGELIVDEVINIIKQNWTGDIYTYKAEGIDLSVTDNHSMLYKANHIRNGKWHKAEAKEIEYKNYIIPTMAESWKGNPISSLFSFEEYFDDDTIIWCKIRQNRWHKILPSCFKYQGSRLMHRCKWSDIKNTSWRPPSDIPCFFAHKIGTSNLIPYYWDTNNMLKLIGWFVTEGHSSFKEFTPYASRKISITQSKDRYLDEIINLFDELKLPYTLFRKDKQREIYTIGVNCGVLYRAFTDWCGIGARNKKLPRFIMDSTEEQITTTFETMIKGDGSKRKDTDTISYYTISPLLKDNFVELSLKLGYSPRVNFRRENFEISLSETRQGRINTSKNLIVSNYNGIVWCVTTKSGNVLVSRNGKFCFVGNCPYPEMKQGSFESQRFNFDAKAAQVRIANTVQQQMGRNRRGFKEHYGDDAPKLNGIADKKWKRISWAMSDDFKESIR